MVHVLFGHSIFVLKTYFEQIKMDGYSELNLILKNRRMVHFFSQTKKI